MAVRTQQVAVPRDQAADLTRLLASPWMLAVILAVAVAAYAPTLNTWFTGDDFWFLRAGQTSSFGEYFARVFDVRAINSQPELNRYRPLYPLAWWLQYQAFGLNALPYHAVALALHLACVTMAWWVFRRLLGPGALANFATMIFALHPAHAEAIAWLSGANRVFAVAPALASLLLYMKACDAGAPRLLLFAAALAMYVVGVLMHSSIVILAPVLAGYTFLVARPAARARDWREWIPLAPFFAIAVASYFVQRWVRSQLGGDEGFSFGFHIYANYASYFALVLVPFRNAGSTASEFVANLKLVASVVVLAVILAVAYRRPFWGLGVFAVLWLLASLLPDATFVIGGLGRVMYNAAAPVALLAALAVVYATERLPEDAVARARAIAPFALVLLVVVLAVAAYGRTRGTADQAEGYRGFADTLRANVGPLPAGGTLYISSSQVAAFAPESQISSMVEMYYGDIDVRVLAPGAETPVLGPDDAWFVYRP